MIEARRGGVVGGEGFVSSPSIRLLPYAPQDTDEWTEEIYAIYHQAQIAVGLRKEATEEEIKADALLNEIDEAISSGEGWLDKVKSYFGDDESFDTLISDEDIVANITKELDEQQEDE